MNERSSDRPPVISRLIDEIAFQTSILALNEAVEAAGGPHAPALGSAQAASDTLALIEQSICQALRGTAGGESAVPLPGPATSRQPETEALAFFRVAEHIRRMRGPGHAAAENVLMRAAARPKRAYGEQR